MCGAHLRVGQGKVVGDASSSLDLEHGGAERAAVTGRRKFSEVLERAGGLADGSERERVRHVCILYGHAYPRA